MILQNTKFQYLIKKIKNIKNPNILELGVNKGGSTKTFLELCDRNNGHLTSVDIVNCEKVSNNPNWKFIHSSDDNFEFINKHIKNPLDVLYIDSLHQAYHVRKVFYNYYKYLKVGGLCFVDDISWLPYIKNKKKENSYVEETNFRIFNKVLEIHDSNPENFFLEFFFEGTGYAIITKKNDNDLRQEKKIVINKINLKNIIKKIFLRRPIR